MDSLNRILRSKVFTLAVMLFILILIFTIITSGRFLSAANMRNILNSMVIVSFLAVGVAFLIISGCIDLSLGAVGTLCGCLMGIIITNWGLPWYVGFLAAIILGIGCGALNAVMVNVLNFQPFIATLAMASIAESLSYVITNGVRIVLDNDAITFIGTARMFGQIPLNMSISLIFLLVYGIILAKTKFGRKVYICGSNKQAARLVGLNPKKISYVLFMNAGFLAALSGCIYASRLKNATVTGISGQQFAGVTAAILGGVSFGGGSGGMLGCFMGLLVLNVFNNGMLCVGINTYVQTIFSGILLIVALTLDFISQRNQDILILKKSLSK